MATCVNHPGVETDIPCANCGRPFCDACLVEFMGQRYCGPCRDLKLAEMQSPGTAGENGRLAGSGTVDISGWLSGGWQLIQPDLGLFVLAALLTGILSIFSCTVVTGPLLAGLYMMCFARMTHGRADLSQLWLGFRRFANGLLVWLITFGISLGVSLVIGAALGVSMVTLGSRGGPFEGLLSGSRFLGEAIGVVVSTLVLAPTFFAMPLVAARNINAVEAFQTSWQIFLRNPGGFLVLALVIEVIERVSLMLCCLPALVVFPWLLAVQARAFSDFFNVEGWDRVL